MIDFENAPSSSSSGDGFGRKQPVRLGLAPGELPIAPPWLDQLNDRQREAVQITEGPLIVLAGAGSGKTKMLTSRIAFLIEACRVPAHNILAVTFTNKAAAEMRERVERTLGIAAQTENRWRGGWGGMLGVPEIGTFHSICVRILRRELDRTPFTKPFVIYDDSDQLSLIKGILDKLGIDDKAFNPKAIQGAINRAKCDALEAADIEPDTHNIFERQMKRAYEQYEKDLIANNALDFGEIICMTYRLFRDNLDIRQKYQARYRYLHVDEYQDTNRAQYLLLTMLANTRYGGHQNICVVGDEDQSIYKWRGADIKNILDFENDYPGAQVVKLEQNYRSTKTIIQAAGQVIKNNRERKDKTLWTDNEEGLPIRRFQLPDERMEAEIAVSEVKRLAANEGRSYGDFAIFYRTNAQSRQFEDVLRREKIPYQIVGGLRFYDRKEIKDVLSYFKVILNPSDSVSLKRIINVPARGIGKTTIEKVDAYSHQLSGNPETAQMSYWDALAEVAGDPSITSAGTAKKLAGFVSLLERLIREQPKLKLSELYHLILDETGYVRDLRQEATEESLARIENLEEFDTLLQEFEEDNFERLPEEEKEARKKDLLPMFIEQSTLASEADQKEAIQSAVKMMTLHSSKGLEFPVVFLVGMEEGLFPSIRGWEEENEEDVEEERRLCYVGMTRARELLYLSSVTMRRLWGDVSFQQPSRFFEEMPAHMIEFKDLSQQQKSWGTATGRSGSGSSSGSGYSYSSTDDDGGYGKHKTTGSGSAYIPSANEMVGKKIDHPQYGRGTILQVEGSGDQQKVTVEFAGRDRRKFLVKYLMAMFED